MADPADTTPAEAPVARPDPSPGRDAGAAPFDERAFMARAVAEMEASVSPDAADPESEGAPPADPAKPAAEAGPGRGKDGKFRGKGAPKDKVPAPRGPAALLPDKRAQLEALAGELGLSVDLTEVHWRERAEVRDQRRRMRAEADAREAALAAKYEQTVSGVKGRLDREAALAAAWEARDHEALAVALGAKSWDEVQSEIIARATDPNFKRLREQDQRLAAMEAERQQAAEREQRSAQARARAQAEEAYFSSMQEQMRGSADPVVAALHDDPMLQAVVYRIQQENVEYDASGRPVVLPPEKAIRLAVKGARTPVVEELRALAGKLARAFPEAVPAQAKADPRRPAPRSAPVAPRRGVDPSVAEYPRTKAGRLDDRAWLTSATARLKEAAASEPRR